MSGLITLDQCYSRVRQYLQRNTCQDSLCVLPIGMQVSRQSLVSMSRIGINTVGGIAVAMSGGESY